MLHRRSQAKTTSTRTLCMTDLEIENEGRRDQRANAVRPRGSPRAPMACQRVHRPYKRKRLARDYLALDNKPFQVDHSWSQQELLQEEAENLLDGIFDDFEYPDQGLIMSSPNACGHSPLLIDQSLVFTNPQGYPQVKEERSETAMILHPKNNMPVQSQTNKPFPGQNTQWSDTEETFLVGAVMDHFFGHGSLTPRRKGNKGGTVWCSIKTTFDDWLGRYASVTGATKPQGRSAKALLRHYKSMKRRSTFFYAIYRKFTSSYEGYIRASYRAIARS